jgi:hypothetical protein
MKGSTPMDIVVSVTPEERLRMQVIAMDGDKDEALALVKALLDRIETAEKRGLCSHSEG